MSKKIEYNLSSINKKLEQIISLESPQDFLLFFSLHAKRAMAYHYMTYYNYNALETLVWLGREKEALEYTQARPAVISGAQISGTKLGKRGATIPQGEKLLGLIRIYNELYKRDKIRTDVIAAVEQNILQAIRSLQKKEDYYQAMEEFTKILIHCGEIDLAESLITARQVKTPVGSSTKLLIDMYIQTAQFAKAENLISEEESEWDRDMHYGDLAKAYIQAECITQAEKTIDKTSSWQKELITPDLAIPYAKKKDFAKAESLLQAPPGSRLIGTMCALAHVYHNFQLYERTQATVQCIEKLIDKIQGWGGHDDYSAEELRAYALMNLAEVYASLENMEMVEKALDKAQAYIGEIGHSYAIQQSHMRLLSTMVSLGLYQRAIAMVSKPPFLFESWFQTNVAVQLAIHKQFDLATTLGEKITSLYNRMEVFIAISTSLAKDGWIAKAQEKFMQAINISRNIYNERDFIDIVCNMSHVLYNAEDNRSLPILLLADKTVRRLITKEEEDSKRNQTKDHLGFILGGYSKNFGGEIRKIIIEFLRHREYKQAYELVHFGKGRSPGSYSLTYVKDILDHLCEAREYLSQAQLAELLDFFKIKSLSDFLYEEILSGTKPIPKLRIKKLKSIVKRGKKENYNRALADLIIEFIKEGTTKKIATWFAKFNLATTDNYDSGRALRFWLQHLLQKNELKQIDKLYKKHQQDRPWLFIILEELTSHYAQQEAYEKLQQLLDKYPDAALYSKAIQALSAIDNIELATQYLTKLRSIKDSHDYKRENRFIEALLAMIKINAQMGKHSQAHLLLQEAFSIANNAGDYAKSQYEQMIQDTMIKCGYLMEVFNKYNTANFFIKNVLKLELSLKKYGANLHIDLIAKILSIYASERPEWVEASRIFST